MLTENVASDSAPSLSRATPPQLFRPRLAAPRRTGSLEAPEVLLSSAKSLLSTEGVGIVREARALILCPEKRGRFRGAVLRDEGFTNNAASKRFLSQRGDLGGVGSASVGRGAAGIILGALRSTYESGFGDRVAVALGRPCSHVDGANRRKQRFGRHHRCVRRLNPHGQG